MHWLLGFTTFPQGKTTCSNRNIQCCVKGFFFSHSWISFRQKCLHSEGKQLCETMNASLNAWHILSQRAKSPMRKQRQSYVFTYFNVLYRCTCICTLKISPLCILATHLQRGSRPVGWADPKGARKFVFSLHNLAIPHFLKVAVPLTHSQGPSQSPFVNRTMFYNAPLFLRWPYQ